MSESYRSPLTQLKLIKNNFFRNLFERLKLFERIAYFILIVNPTV